jgi:hypothetical protein
MPAPKGNQFTRKYHLEEVIPLFELSLKEAQKRDCLHVYTAIKASGIPMRSFMKLCEEHKVLQDIKEEINFSILERINEGALKGDFVSTPSIWRMKQLGEYDESKIDHTNNGGKFESPVINFTKRNESN